ncbi:MAG: DNA repair protein RadC [Firmicutes bacterium]|nr:DNA repair protein RadC [Bacillota bacterium]
MSMHDGHRQRLKERFEKEGLDNFEQVQVLELLLFYCIPKQDTNPIAHALLDAFGSITKVLQAPTRELMQVKGIGESTARYLHMIMEVIRYYSVQEQAVNRILTNVDMCAEYMIPFFEGRRNETVFLLCLDGKCKVISCKKVGEGSVNSAGVPIRRIVEMALGENATSVVLAHNHPSGIALPSDEDRLTTIRLAYALNAVDIELADHIVVADGDYVSMAQSGYYHPRDCRLPI